MNKPDPAQQGASQAPPALVESPAQEKAPIRGWAIFGLLSGITTFGGLVSVTFGVMLPEIRKDISMNPVAVGVMASVFSLFWAFMAVPINNWFSRYNPVRLVAVSGVLGAFFLLAQAYAWNFVSLFAARFLFVIFQSIKNPARTLLLQQWLPLRQIGLANSAGFFIHSLVQTFGITLAALVVLALGGWRLTYAVMAAAMAFQVVLWLAIARQRRTASFEASMRAQQKTPLAALFRYRVFWLVAVGLFGGCLPWQAFIIFLPTFLSEQRGVSFAVAGVATGMLYAGQTTGALFAGFVDRLVPDRRYLIAGSGILLLVCPILVLTLSNLPLIMALAFANGLGWGMLPIIQTLPFHLPGIKPREVAVLSGLINAATGLGLGSGPILAGIVSQATGSMFAALLLLSCFPVLMIGTGLLYPREAARSHS